MKYFILLLLSALFAGCSLFKNTSKQKLEDQLSIAKTNQLRLSADKNVNNEFDLLTFYSDSSNSAYTVHVWPKGTFSFSAEKGFVGEADQVLIKGSREQLIHEEKLLNVTQQEQQSVEIEREMAEKISSKHFEEVKESSPSWKWMLIGILFISLGLM